MSRVFRTFVEADEGKIQEHLGDVVHNTVEETLNAMLEPKQTVFAAPSVRTDQSTEGYAGGFLPAALTDESRRSDAESAEVAPLAI